MRKYKYQSIVDANWAAMPRVTGKVTAAATPVPELQNRRVLQVTTEDSIVRIYESFGLKELFDNAAVGDHVDIEYRGTKAIKNSRTLKEFNARLWTE